MHTGKTHRPQSARHSASHGSHASHPSHGDRAAHGGHDHAAMIGDFRRRFWVCLILTVPVLALSPAIQRFLGLDTWLTFAGQSYALFVLASVVYFYGGWPFLRGLLSELGKRQPGMMTLIWLAVSGA